MEIQFMCQNMLISPGNALDLWLEFKEVHTHQELIMESYFFADVCNGYENARSAIAKAGISVEVTQ